MEKPWKEQAASITGELSNLRALMNIYDITCDDIDMDALGAKLNKLQDTILPKIQIIESKIRKHGLRNKLRNKISNIDTFLGSMTQPALTLTHGQEYDDHIYKVTMLITIARLNLLDVKANHKENTRTRTPH